MSSLGFRKGLFRSPRTGIYLKVVIVQNGGCTMSLLRHVNLNLDRRIYDLATTTSGHLGELN